MSRRCVRCQNSATYLRIARATLSISPYYLSTIEPSHPSALGFRPIANCRLPRPNGRRDRSMGGVAIAMVGAGIGLSVWPASHTYDEASLPRRRPMRVKLCERCPYTPRDLADHYDSEAARHLCATCDVKYDLRNTQRRRTCPTTTIDSTGTGTAQRYAAPFVTESSASFAIIAAAPHSVRGNASSISGSAGRATANGYGKLEPSENRSGDHARDSRRSRYPDKEPAC